MQAPHRDGGEQTEEVTADIAANKHSPLTGQAQQLTGQAQQLVEAGQAATAGKSQVQLMKPQQ